MNAVETLIMQAVLKSVKDYNNSIEMLAPAVKKYFKDNYDDIWYHLYEWHLVDNGNNIEITYTEQYLSGAMEYNTDVVPLETIVSIAVELSFNKKIRIRTMKLWIARDFDGGLYTFINKPWLQTIDKMWLDFPVYIDWKDDCSYYKQLDCNLYPEITFENSPQMIELKLVKDYETLDSKR